MRAAFKTAAVVVAAGAALLLSACATRIDLPTKDAGLRLRVQSSVIAPGNGGELIAADALEPGDILLTSIATVNSFGIRLGTFSPVSHAVLYLGDGQIAEAVGTGVRARPLADLVDEEQMVVAFRVPGVDEAGAGRMREWALSQVGARYNTVGVLLNAPFVLNRRLCELPLVPSAVSNYCVSGMAMVQLGASRDDQFFCSQFVLEAYKQAGLPITSADPRWVSPSDLLHMREGDVPSIAATQPLRYVGHLKYNPPPLLAADGLERGSFIALRRRRDRRGGRRAVLRRRGRASAGSRCWWSTTAKRVAEKIRISGGGRANFTNRDLDVRAPQRHFIGDNPNFCRSALSRYAPQQFIELVAAARHRLPREAQGPAVLRRLVAADHRHAAGRMRGGWGGRAGSRARSGRLCFRR